MAKNQPTTAHQHESNDTAPNRWHLIRDVAVFQFKLALDGIRDLVLLPVSLVAAIAGILASPDNPGKYFNRILEFGRRSDVWINLFSASEHYAQSDETSSSDAYLAKLEQMLIDEYQRGGVVRNIKDRADDLMDRIQEEAAKSSPKEPSSPAQSPSNDKDSENRTAGNLVQANPTDSDNKP